MLAKSKILSCALLLFNEHGLHNVSSRMIANELQISPGNLTYHFKKKEDLIFELYVQLVQEISLVFEKSAGASMSVKLLYNSTVKLYGCFLKYQFCMVDFVQLMRTQPKIKQHFNQLMELRQAQFADLFTTAIHAKVLLPEEFSGQYQLLAMSMSIHGDYWLSHAEVLFKGSKEQALQQYVKSFMNLYYPYLTTAAKEEFRKIVL